MNLRSLRIFRQVVITGSLAEASERLNISPSAASRLLSLLEAEIKLTLFSRERRRLELTEEGDLFYRQMEHILRGIDEIPAVSDDIKRRTRERLSLVTAPPIAMGIIAPTLAQMRTQGMEFECMVNVETRFDIESKVAARSYNLGIISLPVENAIIELAIEPFMEARLEVVMPASHPLASREHVDANHLAGQPMVALSVGQRWRDRLDAVFATASVRPEIAVETSSTAVVMQCVRDGLGLTVADRICGRLRPGEPLVMRPIWPERWITYASIHPKGPRPALANRFVQEMCALVERECLGNPDIAAGLRLLDKGREDMAF